MTKSKFYILNKENTHYIISFYSKKFNETNKNEKNL